VSSESARLIPCSTALRRALDEGRPACRRPARPTPRCIASTPLTCTPVVRRMRGSCSSEPRGRTPRWPSYPSRAARVSSLCSSRSSWRARKPVCGRSPRRPCASAMMAEDATDRPPDSKRRARARTSGPSRHSGACPDVPSRCTSRYPCSPSSSPPTTSPVSASSAAPRVWSRRCSSGATTRPLPSRPPRSPARAANAASRCSRSFPTGATSRCASSAGSPNSCRP
jgi:hypothetical protein